LFNRPRHPAYTHKHTWTYTHLIHSRPFRTQVRLIHRVIHTLTRYRVQVTDTQLTHNLIHMLLTGYPQTQPFTAQVRLIHRRSTPLLTGYPQSYPQPECYPQDIHTRSTGYPQGAVIHKLSTALLTGYPQSYPQVVLLLTVSTWCRFGAIPYYSTGSLHEPYNPDAVVVIIIVRSGAVHPLLFEHEFIIAGEPYTNLTTMETVRSLSGHAASTSIPDLLSNTSIITPEAYTSLTTLGSVGLLTSPQKDSIIHTCLTQRRREC
jgi:hypothetical protein